MRELGRKAKRARQRSASTRDGAEKATNLTRGGQGSRGPAAGLLTDVGAQPGDDPVQKGAILQIREIAERKRRSGGGGHHLSSHGETLERSNLKRGSAASTVLAMVRWNGSIAGERP